MQKTIEMIPEEENLPQKIFLLEDLCQKYHNMLTYIHNLSEAEREQILSWKVQHEEELKTLKER